MDISDRRRCFVFDNGKTQMHVIIFNYVIFKIITSVSVVSSVCVVIHSFGVSDSSSKVTLLEYEVEFL